MSELRNGLRVVPEPGTEDEAVARWIRLAGRRPPVPEEDAAIVRAAAHAQWRQTVATERRRNRFYRGAGGLLAAAALWALFVGTGLWQQVARVFADPVAVTAGLDPATVGQEFRVGDDVETGAEALTLQMLATGESVRVAAHSRLRFDASSVLKLEEGAVYVDSTGPASTFQIRTALSRVRHIGTQFEVRASSATDETRVRVREGQVEVIDRWSGQWLLKPGEELNLTKVNRTKAEAPCHGAEWEWVIIARPPFDTRNRSVLEVLEWGAREGCWSLEFADEADRSQVADIVLGSSILPDGSLEEALDAVLLGSSTGLRLDPTGLADGIFRVERR